MVAALKQIVTVQPGGVIQLRSKTLRAGEEVEVIVRKNGRAGNDKEDKPRASRHPIARMTKQVRGDVAEAKRAQKAIREGREKLIPWGQVKRELGLK